MTNKTDQNRGTKILIAEACPVPTGRPVQRSKVECFAKGTQHKKANDICLHCSSTLQTVGLYKKYYHCQFQKRVKGFLFCSSVGTDGKEMKCI